MARVIDLQGRRFGRLVVLKQSGFIKDYASWLCRCDCGNMKIVSGMDLRRGYTISCGCFKKEFGARIKTHGLTGSCEYSVWAGMIRRCTNPNDKSYKYYGGRGIKVCEKWRNSFSEFFKDMKRKPFPKAEIDRIDNDGNYEPTNCRWVDDRTQANNKRKKYQTKNT